MKVIAVVVVVVIVVVVAVVVVYVSVDIVDIIVIVDFSSVMNFPNDEPIICSTTFLISL